MSVAMPPRPGIRHGGQPLRAAIVAGVFFIIMGNMASPAAAQAFTAQPPFGQVPVAPRAAVTDNAYAAYQTGFYDRAFTEATARIARDNNDTAAMTLLGELFRQGLGQKTDLAKAAEWYRLAHDRGDANATFALAMATLKGEGVTKDLAAGRRLLEAASTHNPQAAHNLALVLLSDPAATERAKAIPLLERAASAEIADAQHALAVLKRKGQDTAVDLEGAAGLMRRAAQNGSEAGEIEYAILLFNGQGTPRDETKAADLFQRLAIRGNAIAQNRYAKILAAGRGRPRDSVAAAAWNLVASQQGLADEGLDRIFDNLAIADKGRALSLAAQLTPGNLTPSAATGQ